MAQLLKGQRIEGMKGVALPFRGPIFGTMVCQHCNIFWGGNSCPGRRAAALCMRTWSGRECSSDFLRLSSTSYGKVSAWLGNILSMRM